VSEVGVERHARAPAAIPKYDDHATQSRAVRRWRAKATSAPEATADDITDGTITSGTTSATTASRPA